MSLNREITEPTGDRSEKIQPARETVFYKHADVDGFTVIFERKRGGGITASWFEGPVFTQTGGEVYVLCEITYDLEARSFSPRVATEIGGGEPLAEKDVALFNEAFTELISDELVRAGFFSEVEEEEINPLTL